jgi:cullin-associated NEDD8-dissociated protein 1
MFAKDYKRETNLFMYSDLSQDFPELADTLFGYFSSSSEEIKYAAAFALGNISLGNVEKNLPGILSTIRDNEPHRYLLFITLKEIISKLSVDEVDPETLRKVLPDIWTLLIENTSEATEDTIRNAVAECLGKICSFEPLTYLPKLKSQISATSHNSRATTVAALRFTFMDPLHGREDFDVAIQSLLLDFFKLVSDDDQV